MLASSQFKDDSFFMDQKKTLYEHIAEISTEPALFAASNYIPFQLHVPSYTYGLITGENWYERRVIAIPNISEEPEKVKIFAVMVRNHAGTASDNTIVTMGNRLNRGFLYSAYTYDKILPNYNNGSLVESSRSPIKIPNRAVYANIIVPSDMNYAVLIGENHPTDAHYVVQLHNGEWRTEGIFDVTGYADGEHYIVVKIGYINGEEIPEDFDTSVIDFYFTDANGNVIEPIAYLYNGVRLPALPEWDKTVYPYAVIGWLYKDSSVDDTKLYYFSVRGAEFTITEDGQFWVTNAAARYCSNGTEWEETKAVYQCYPLWSNYDVYQDSTLLLEASNPIPIYNEPVNYLYNGVKLPKLPEWDKTVYPYAVISVNPSGVYELVIDSDSIKVGAGGTTSALFPDFKYRCVDGEWQSSSATAFNFVPVWGNNDIYWGGGENKGKLFLESSEPIPIYE